MVTNRGISSAGEGGRTRYRVGSEGKVECCFEVPVARHDGEMLINITNSGRSSHGGSGPIELLVKHFKELFDDVRVTLAYQERLKLVKDVRIVV